MESEKILLQENQPTMEMLNAFVNSPTWEKFNLVLTQVYGTSLMLEYSKCSMQRGWNVKYRRKGKNLCTAYPMEGYFRVLVVITKRNQAEADSLIESCCDFIKQIYEQKDNFNGSKWLMIDVNNEDILEDTLRLIRLKIC